MRKKPLWRRGAKHPVAQEGKRLSPEQLDAILSKPDKTPDDVALLKLEYDFASRKDALLDGVVYYEEGGRPDEAKRRESLNHTRARVGRELDRLTNTGQRVVSGGHKGANLRASMTEAEKQDFLVKFVALQKARKAQGLPSGDAEILSEMDGPPSGRTLSRIKKKYPGLLR